MSMLTVPLVGTLVLAFPVTTGCDQDHEFDDELFTLFTSPLVKLLSLPHGEDVRFSVCPVLLVSVMS